MLECSWKYIKIETEKKHNDKQKRKKKKKKKQKEPNGGGRCDKKKHTHAPMCRRHTEHTNGRNKRQIKSGHRARASLCLSSAQLNSVQVEKEEINLIFYNMEK